jgi:hypothetical protein
VGKRLGREYDLIVRARFDILLPPKPLNLSLIADVASKYGVYGLPQHLSPGTSANPVATNSLAFTSNTTDWPELPGKDTPKEQRRELSRTRELHQPGRATGKGSAKAPHRSSSVAAQRATSLGPSLPQPPVHTNSTGASSHGRFETVETDDFFVSKEGAHSLPSSSAGTKHGRHHPTTQSAPKVGAVQACGVMFLPFGADWDGVNDQFAIGTTCAMKAYALVSFVF